jgi:2-polyprenyl-3-methyl-5-hydroxy-6-metoxy-1,4-benzoquinol methylase
MALKPDAAKSYFSKIPREWDALYAHENLARYFFNRVLRRALFERRRLTFEECGEISGATVLDIGCGTGRFSIEFALRGASRVVGIDFALSMIEFAKSQAEKMTVPEKCEFICDDFLAHEFQERFDIVVAMGFFDYTPEPQQVLKKIHSLSRGVFLASFPRDSLIWGLQRRIRYRFIKKCPVYHYNRGQLEDLYQAASFTGVKVLDTPHGFFVIAGRSRPL